MIEKNCWDFNYDTMLSVCGLVYYYPLDNGTVELTIIHDMQNTGEALKLCYGNLK